MNAVRNSLRRSTMGYKMPGHFALNNSIKGPFINHNITFNQSRKFSLIKDVAMFSWGSNSSGQLAYGVNPGAQFVSFQATEPRRVKGSSDMKSIAIGTKCSFCVRHDGFVLGCGEGLVDFFGNMKKAYHQPVPLPFPCPIDKVAVGPNHAAAVGKNGKVYTWGKNGGWMDGGGQLGHGDYSQSNAPKEVVGLEDIVDVSCGELHTLFLNSKGEMFACGVGEYGRCGVGHTDDVKVPEKVEWDEKIVQISAGYDHSLALTQSGKVIAWGRNNHGQLGHSDSFMDMYSVEPLPRPIDDVRDNNDEKLSNQVFTHLQAGHDRSIMVNKDGQVFIWGSRLTQYPRMVDSKFFKNRPIRKVAIGGTRRDVNADQFTKTCFAAITESGDLFTFGDASTNLFGIAGVEHEDNAGFSLTKVVKAYASPAKVTRLESYQVLDIYSGFGFHMFAKCKNLPI